MSPSGNHLTQVFEDEASGATATISIKCCTEDIDEWNDWESSGLEECPYATWDALTPPESSDPISSVEDANEAFGDSPWETSFEGAGDNTWETTLEAPGGYSSETSGFKDSGRALGAIIIVIIT